MQATGSKWVDKQKSSLDRPLIGSSKRQNLQGNQKGLTKPDVVPLSSDPLALSSVWVTATVAVAVAAAASEVDAAAAAAPRFSRW